MSRRRSVFVRRCSICRVMKSRPAKAGSTKKNNASFERIARKGDRLSDKNNTTEESKSAGEEGDLK